VRAWTNPILSAAFYSDAGGGCLMPVQRKVFRIEESARLRGPRPAETNDTEGAPHREFVNAYASLRALIEPGESQDAQRRAQAQIAQAQAFKRELELIHKSVAQSRGDISILGAEADRFARVNRELAAIVAGTETATQSILRAAEDIDHAAGTLAAALKSAHDQGLAQDIQDRVVQIFEASRTSPGNASPA